MAGCTAVLQVWGIMGSGDTAVGDNHGGSMGVVTKMLNFKSVLKVRGDRVGTGLSRSRNLVSKPWSENS